MDDIVKEAKEKRTEAIAFKSESRDIGIQDMEFELGGEYAWDKDIWRQRGKRPRASLNNVSTKKHRLANDLRNLNPEIRLVPTRSQWQKIADLRNSKLKEIQERSCAEGIYDACFCQGLAAAFSFMLIETQYVSPTTFDQEIVIKNINNNLSVHYDFDHQNPSYIDMKWGSVEGKIPLDYYREKYGGFSALNWNTDAFEGDNTGEYVYTNKYWRIHEVPKKLYKLSDGGQGILEGYSDTTKIRDALNFEVEGQKVWHLVDERDSYKPQLQWYLMNGAEIIDEEKEALGSYIPIIPYEGRVIWIRGKQYLISFIRNLKEPSRFKNYGKSLEIEMVALQPLNTVSAPYEAIKDFMEYYQDANNTAYPVLPWNHLDDDKHPIPEPKREMYRGPSNQLAGLFQSYDKDILDISGMPDDSLTSSSAMRLPGAIELKNNQGNHNNYDFIDNFVTRTLRYAGIVMNDLITEVHNVEDEWELEKEGEKTLVPINQEGGVDITEGEFKVQTVIASASKSEQKESVDSLLSLLQQVPGMQSAAHIIVKNMEKIKDKDEIVKILKAQLSPAVQKALGSEKSTAVENMQLTQQLEAVTAQYEQAAEIIKTMEIDRNKAVTVQGMKSATELEKAEMNNTTTLIKVGMEKQGKAINDLNASIQQIGAQLASLAKN